MSDNDWGPSAAFFGPKYCLKFDGAGSNDYVDCGTGNTDTSTITLESWVYLSHDVTNFDRIIIKSQDGGLTLSDSCFALNCNNSEQPVFTVGGTSVTSPDSVSQDEWHHIAGTFDKDAGSDQMKLYVDGMLSATGTRSTAVPTSAHEITLGASYADSSGDYYLDGRLDEVRIWNRVLSAAEIRENMFQIMIGDGTNLLNYWNCDMTEGDTLPDYDQGGGVEGTLMNMEDADWIASSAFTTWLNTGSSAWSTATNWSGASVPESSDNAGIYTYTGGTNVSLSDTPILNHMLLGASSAMTLSSNLTVNGNLILESNLDLDGQTITLGSSGYLIEDAGRLYGTSGTITTTRTLSNITSENVAGLGAVITTSANMGETDVTRGHSSSSGSGLQKSIYRYYEITPTTNTGLNATLKFYYNTNELNGILEENLALFRWDTNKEKWQCNAANQTRDPDNDGVQQTAIGAFSKWTLGDENDPLLVDLVSFTATGFDDHVLLEWETASEIDNAGFHLRRTETEDAEYNRITDYLIPAEGGPTQGAEYSHEDFDVVPGLTYYYQLEDIDYDGISTFHGPVSATLSDEAIALVFPEDGVLVPVYPPPAFEWVSADLVRFKLGFSRSPDFTGRVVVLPRGSKRHGKWITGESYTPNRRE